MAPSTNRRRRLLVPLLIVIGWLVAVGVAGPAASSLSAMQTNDLTGSLPAASQSAQVAADVARIRPGDGTVPTLVLFTSTTDGAQLTAAQHATIADTAAHLPGRHTPPVFAADGQAALIVVSTPAGAGTADDVAALRTAVAGAGAAGMHTYVAGVGGFLADLVGALGSIDGVLLAVSLAVVAVILLTVYRAVLLPAIVLGTAMCALAVASGGIYVAAKAGALTLSGQSQGLMTILVIGASTDYCLLFVAAYKSALHATGDARSAAWTAWRRTIGAVTASAATVAAAVMCLTLSGLPAVASLGPVAAGGVAAAWAASVTLLPAVLALLGRRAFWPRIPRPDGAIPDGGRFWLRVSTAVARRPGVLTAVVCTVLAVAAVPAIGFTPTGVTADDVFTVPTESVTGNHELGRHFPATTGSETLVVAATADVPAAVAVLNATPHMFGAAPYLGADGAPASVAGRSLITVNFDVAGDSPAAYAAIDAARANLPVSAAVGGPSAERHDTNTAAAADLGVIVPAVLAVIAVILVGLLRSIVAAVLLVGSVVLSFAATLGVGVAVFHAAGFTGVDASVPLFAFVFLVALGVDYSIFLMSAARFEAGTAGTREGMLTALRATGGVITSAGVVLAATFATLAVLPISFLLQMAFLVCVGVLLDTLVVRTLLVPSAVMLLGERTWWPSRPGPHGQLPVGPAAPAREQ